MKLYNHNYTLTKDGSEAIQECSPLLEKMYLSLIDRGFSPLAAKEIMLNIVHEIDLDYKFGILKPNKTVLM